MEIYELLICVICLEEKSNYRNHIMYQNINSNNCVYTSMRIIEHTIIKQSNSVSVMNY